MFGVVARLDPEFLAALTRQAMGGMPGCRHTIDPRTVSALWINHAMQVCPCCVSHGFHHACERLKWWLDRSVDIRLQLLEQCPVGCGAARIPLDQSVKGSDGL